MRRWQRTIALLSVLCLVAGASVSAPRGCSVCPVGCPMHVARAEQPGCHRGRLPAAADTHHAPPARCTMRASCGHVEQGSTALPAVMCSPPTIVSIWREARVPRPPAPGPMGLVPEPPTDPPRTLLA